MLYDIPCVASVAKAIMHQRHTEMIGLDIAVGVSIRGTLMKIQNNLNDRPSLLTLVGMATIVLLVFAWTLFQ